MPPSKRKFSEVSADVDKPAVPPQLPPSVEEAYRRKCVELKRRNHQVEEANDAARVRIARIKRQVEKLRIERAFLLEQLTKRTSTNVEDSEGSPSPPPTVCSYDIVRFQAIAPCHVDGCDRPYLYAKDRNVDHLVTALLGTGLRFQPYQQGFNSIAE